MPRVTIPCCLLLPILALLVLPPVAAARDENSRASWTQPRLVDAQFLIRTREAHPGIVGDTVYAGFVSGAVNPVSNYWGIGVGKFITSSTLPADYGYWGWDNDAIHDNISQVHGDSLFGWWPYRFAYTETGGRDLPDTQRPWWALDYGNNCNYVLNQGKFDANATNPAPNNRTFGIIGAWHPDDGSGLGWTPIAGARSLWCGLRRPGDPLAPTDPITGNPFDGSTLQFNRVGVGPDPGPVEHFPGYASQWDQMAYRDVNVGAATTIQVRFTYRTAMSEQAATDPAVATGWFEQDPLSMASFVSASSGSPPVDAFIAYVGGPVDPATGFFGSDGLMHPVSDPLRLWFSEVLRIDENPVEMLRVTGNHATTTFTSATYAIPPSWGGTARVVFRVKTNRGFDDESGDPWNSYVYSSGGAGAAILDDVEVKLDTGSFVSIGDFESSASVDDRPNVSALTAWKTTGKPPGIYPHVHELNSLVYQDLCGPPGNPESICNMLGNVISAGDHDQFEAAGGFDSDLPEYSREDAIISPTINLRHGAGTPNAMGIDHAIATATNDYYLVYDVYTGEFNLDVSGNAWWFGWQCYPEARRDGTPGWGNWRVPDFVLYDPYPQCFQDWEPARGLGLLNWDPTLAADGSDHPDSVRVMLGKIQECFRFGVSLGCSPTTGCYWDNVAVAFVDGPRSVVSVQPWQWLHDSFPEDGLTRNFITPGLAAFDTTAALIKSGLNISAEVGSEYRCTVPGDSMVAVAGGTHRRMDLVFRISPGPGNYLVTGDRSSGLRAVPTAPLAVNYTQTGAGQAMEHNFWAQYLANNGPYGNPGGHPAGAVNGGRTWDPLIWNSARCDTAEHNLWLMGPRDIGGPRHGFWSATYHESDPNYTTLGIAKNRCFLITATTSQTDAHVVCDVSLTDGWPLAAGYVAENGLPLGQTYEYTKILPDGLFTPGTHVEYYFRASDELDPADVSMTPDPTVVTPQPGEGSLDAHRWQEFSVLPDTWKKTAYGGLGQACMLYVDMDDRRGDEGAWYRTSVAIGATAAASYGAHNGWKPIFGLNPNDPSGFVEANGQPGTTWDMYGVKGSESLTTKAGSIGSALQVGSCPDFAGRTSTLGPTPMMLESYYHVLLVHTGDISTRLMGPDVDQGSDDNALLADFLSSADAADTRGVWVEGQGFAVSESQTSAGLSLLDSFFGASLRSDSYFMLTLTPTACLQVTTTTPFSTTNVFGLRNGCTFLNSVLDANPATMAQPSAFYPVAGGVTPPVVAGVYGPMVGGTRYFETLLDGWDFQSFLTMYCSGTSGRATYYYDVLNTIFQTICTITGPPVQVLDVPQAGDGQPFVDLLRLRNNPLTSGTAKVDLELSRPGHLEVILFDVSGRVVRRLADREFAAGTHTLIWDGTADDGRPVPRGVYFAKVRESGGSFDASRKLVLLR